MRKLLLGILLFAAASSTAQSMPADVQNLCDHIRQVMPQSVRENTTDHNGLVGLPKPYSVPCIRGAFQEMYYWDTYFTNEGLLLLGDTTQARNNIDDILYMIDSWGFMPNGSIVEFRDTRSQPPYASLMVRRYYERTHDRKWLASAVRTLEKEYAFWMTKRIAPNGLNRYGHHASDAYLLNFYQIIAGRLSVDPNDQLTSRDERLKAGAHWLAEAESGWDFNPRYSQRCMDFNPVDLNANLYLYETNFAYFYKQLGLKHASQWTAKAKARKALMNRYCMNSADGLFYDYDFVNRRLSTLLSGGIFNLMYAGVLNKAQAAAVAKQLGRLELPYGISACEKGTRTLTYQWDYPNVWAAINYMAIGGLDRYGYTEAARRIARKYVESNVRQFESTGVLWEKYNGETGNNDAASEYATPGDFMGWTAGTFLFAAHYLYK